MIGHENLGVEFKTFKFNPLLLSQDEALEYLKTGEFNFNESVDLTIMNYIITFLPKYICAFLHPLSKLFKRKYEYGTLYIGVDDDGIVHGIPYNGKFGSKIKSSIKSKINEMFEHNLRFVDDGIKQFVKRNLTIEIIHLGIDNVFKKELQSPTIYNCYVKQLKRIQTSHEKYLKRRTIWENLSDAHLPKLNDMINDMPTRKIIWEFLKEKHFFSKKQFKNKYSHLEIYCDVDNYWNLMSKFKSGYLFGKIKFRTISNVKEDGLNIYRWITFWKDSKMKMMKRIKPRPPLNTMDSNYPTFLLSHSVKMLPLWIVKNPNLNLYVIKIILPIYPFNTYSQRLGERYICAFKNSNDEWRCIYRTNEFGQPTSVTF